MLRQFLQEALQARVSEICKGQRENGVGYMPANESAEIVKTLSEVDLTKVRALVVVAVTDADQDGKEGTLVGLAIGGTAQLLDATFDLVKNQLETSVEERTADDTCQCRKCKRRRGELNDAGEVPAVDDFDGFMQRRGRGESSLDQLLRQRGGQSSEDLFGLALMSALLGGGRHGR